MKKFIFSMMAAVTACSLLTACDDDDDDDAGSTVYNADATVLTTSDGEKLLVTECDSYNYSYNDNGHLTYISDNDGGLGSYDVSWDPFTFECEEDEGNSTVSLTTNSNGFVTKTVFSENYEDSWEEWQDTETANYSYDSSGHLTKITYSGTHKHENADHDKCDETISGTITLTWSDGNLTKMVQTETEVEDGDSYVWTETKYFDYEDADENVTKQYVPTLLVLWKDHIWLGGQFDSSMLAYIGLLGVGPEELPVSVSGEDDEDGDTWDYEYTCSYRFNSNGSVNYYSGYCSGYIEYDDLDDE